MQEQENPDPSKKVEEALFGKTGSSEASSRNDSNPAEDRKESMDQSFYRKEGLDYLYF